MRQIQSLIWNDQSGFQYNSQTENNDIVILKLSSPLAMGDTIQAACLPSTSYWYPENDPNWKCFVSGWGTMSSG